MEKTDKYTETKVTTFSSEKRWRFIRTKRGVEYCVEQLLFKGGKLRELDCYRFGEDGIKSTIHLKPAEVEDMTEIAEFLSPQ